MEICKIKDITFTYPSQERPALRGINLAIQPGTFVVLFGESGSGKTTLLRMLKEELKPHGSQSGTIQYDGADIQEMEERDAASEIGFVMQNPDTQIVTDKVWHELAFGLENLGVPASVIRRRVAEIANYFGIHTWFREKTADLSGGEKQLLNVASIMAMQPNMLVLDEPTSELDPIAASTFIQMLEKLNRDFGLTIVMAEHHLEEVLPLAEQVVLLEDGQIICADEPEEIGWRLQKLNVRHRMIQALPAAVKVFQKLDGKGQTPLTVREGKRFLSHYLSGPLTHTVSRPEPVASKEIILEVKQAWFRYERDLPDIVRAASLSVRKGEVISVLGGNGSGKTTLLKLMAGQEHAYRGNVYLNGKKLKTYKSKELYRHNIAVLPQNSNTVFLKSTIWEDYEEIANVVYKDAAYVSDKIQEVAETLSIAPFLDQHPYDLSGGEQQKAALGKILLLEPTILLLDEPTNGLDVFSKQSLQQILRDLQKQGKTIVMNTHDVEFSAGVSDRVGLFFDGDVISVDTPERFFSENRFYTTAASRMSRHVMNGAVTSEAVVRNCLQKQNMISY